MVKFSFTNIFVFIFGQKFDICVVTTPTTTQDNTTSTDGLGWTGKWLCKQAGPQQQQQQRQQQQQNYQL